MLIGIRPGDSAHVDTSGVIYTPQDENGAGNIGYYEVTATGDSVTFDVADRMGAFDTPILELNSIWGETEFDLIDTVDGEAVVSEFSGFSNDVWLIDISGTSGRFRLEIADNSGSVDGTIAAWLPYVGLMGAQA